MCSEQEHVAGLSGRAGEGREVKGDTETQRRAADLFVFSTSNAPMSKTRIKHKRPFVPCGLLVAGLCGI